MTNSGKAQCHASHRNTVLCRPPTRLVGPKTPGKVRNQKSTINAVKRYARAMMRIARERTTENWANRRIAVIESQTIIAVVYAGTKASIRYGWTPDSGP